MNIEKALRNYLKGSGPRVKYKAFYECAEKNPNAVISVLFDLLNEEVDSMTDTKCLNKTWYKTVARALPTTITATAKIIPNAINNPKI